MEKFDINRVIERYSLDTEEVAKVLFPNVKYPKQALDRILKKESNLDTEQLTTLASYIGVLTHELFTAGSVDEWKASSENSRLVFKKGEYKVLINYNDTFVSIYKGTELVHTGVINKTGMSFDSFINYINNIINSNNGNN